MADGIIGGILGEEDEKADVEATETLVGPDGFAAAVAAKLAGSDPEVARETAAFLRNQSQLVNIQAAHLKEDHAARLHYLQGQAREVDIRRLGLRLRVGFQLFLVLVATAIALGGAVMVRDAVTSRRVVVEPFHAPPSMAARGIDGAVVAAGLLDNLSHLQDSTRSSSAARSLSGAWTGNIKLDVPDTGISLGEISRLLRERFGNDVHIEGDLVETTAGGLALTVRGNGVPAMTFEGSATELGQITGKAAEYVYSKSQPARWATHLTNVGRNEEAIAFSRAAMTGVDPAERPWLLNAWAIGLQSSGGSVREGLNLFRAAVRLQPDYWVAHNNIQNSLMTLGDEEGSWKSCEEMRVTAGGRPGKAPETFYTNCDTLSWNLRPWLDATIADSEANGGIGTALQAAGPTTADIYARLHDLESAELALNTSAEDPNDPSGAAMIHNVRGRMAAEAGDLATALAEIEAYGIAYSNPAVSTNNAGYHCWIAPIEEAAGHPDKADAFLKTAGTYVDCYRFRADILDGRGDWPAAQKAYAEAVALAPDLPAAYFSWGVALLKHGDLAAAEAKLMDANKRGPHWADPLKVWGDVLASEGHMKEALAKYDEAIKYAPNWKQLQEAREALAKQKV
jgi:tetratricopeptide (TPR) repeat protein